MRTRAGDEYNVGNSLAYRKVRSTELEKRRLMEKERYDNMAKV